MTDTLRLTDHPLIDAGKVCWSMSGEGVGERVRISRYGSYDAPKKPPMCARPLHYWKRRLTAEMRRKSF